MNWECAQNIHRTSEEGQTGRTVSIMKFTVHAEWQLTCTSSTGHMAVHVGACSR